MFCGNKFMEEHKTICFNQFSHPARTSTYIIIWCATDGTTLALDTLPPVFAYGDDHVGCKLQTRWVACNRHKTLYQHIQTLVETMTYERVGSKISPFLRTVWCTFFSSWWWNLCHIWRDVISDFRYDIL
jgi:hypothetical protein